MNSRIFTAASRRIQLSLRPLALRIPVQRRLASSEHKSSNVGNFYKTFTRPVAKVLLVAVFTYQLAYWGWVKLEQDETKAELEDEIAHLEKHLTTLLRDSPTVRKAMDFLDANGVDTASVHPEEIYRFSRQSPEEQKRLAQVYLAAELDRSEGPTKAEKGKPAGKLSAAEELQMAQQKLMELERQIKGQQLTERGGAGVEDGQEGRKSSWWKFW